MRTKRIPLVCDVPKGYRRSFSIANSDGAIQATIKVWGTPFVEYAERPVVRGITPHEMLDWIEESIMTIRAQCEIAH